jgi:hypothetical protein
MAPHRRLPVVIEVAQPVRDLHKGRSRTHRRVREPDAVVGGAEADLLRRRLAGRECRGRDRRVSVDLVDLADELVAASTDGAHQPLRRAVVTERLAQCLDPAGEGRFAHEAVPPHRVEDLLLRDHAIPLPHEKDEHVEHLWLDPASATAAAELVPAQVELTVVERVDHGRQLLDGCPWGPLDVVSSE